LAGFAGAALAIVGGRQLAGGLSWGYLAAAGSAFVWASYSLLTQRVDRFPTAAIGLFGLVSGLLALACHALLEPAVAISPRDWLLIVVVGVGPLGAAFFFWDAALKRSDPRRIGLLSYLTPLASTLLLAATSGRTLTWWTAAAALLIAGAAVVGMRTR
jgi:drug/metabolite transporter (DMT)-like permease